jgi:hypothetical protein
MGRPSPTDESIERRERELLYTSASLIHPPQKLWFSIDLLAIHHGITLFRAITVLCGTDSIMWNILHIHTECELYSAKDCQSCRTLIVME